MVAAINDDGDGNENKNDGGVDPFVKGWGISFVIGIFSLSFQFSCSSIDGK